jgi:MoxR-like ATPase
VTGTNQPGGTDALGADNAEQPNAWWIYQGTGQPHDRISRLPAPPRWRAFDGGPLVEPPSEDDAASARRLGSLQRATTYRAEAEIAELVNAALFLRRPLLVTGKAGTGKSTLAYSIAHELRLGPVLHWPITSRSTRKDGLYRYDAIGRLQEASLARTGAGDGASQVPDIGRYIRLGPVGTALLPQAKPRVLLIDELDKGDIDLPGDLLNLFEDGEFEIDELTRLPDELADVHVLTEDGGSRVLVERGRVRCRAFPVVIITSNGEREFAPAFLRRCLRLDIKPPDREKLASIVAAQLGDEALTSSQELIDEFLRRRDHGDLAADQLLNAVYLAMSGTRPPGTSSFASLLDAVLRPLDVAGSS